MSTEPFILKCNSQFGVLVLDNLSKESTVAELKKEISNKIRIQSQNLRIVYGYPRKHIEDGSGDKKLMDCDIRSGDTIMLEVLAASAVAGVDNNEIPTTSCKASPDEKSSTDTSSKESPDDKSITDTSSKGSFESSMERAEVVQTGIMMRHVVPSNNSCLFSSIYYLMYEGLEDYTKANDLRRVIAKAVTQNDSRYTSAVLDMNPYEYCTWIMNPSHWGGGIELSILSDYYNIEICAIDIVGLKMHHFGENSHYPRRVFLVYDGIHYDPLVMELNNTTQFIFSVSDESAVEMSMELAREARSSRQYTDVANFTLKCSICGLNLRGDREARAHAMDTGHVEFGEV